MFRKRTAKVHPMPIITEHVPFSNKKYQAHLTEAKEFREYPMFHPTPGAPLRSPSNKTKKVMSRYSFANKTGNKGGKRKRKHHKTAKKTSNWW
jgi:hypothetical protein